MIPLGDLKRQHDEIKDEIEEAVLNVLNSGWFILGRELEEFEKEFALYCERKFAIGVGNGTDALFLVLKALDIGNGDEVISVANTAIPTISAISASGAKAVLVDCQKDYLIDAERIEDAITERTKAIIPVHLFGQCCNMDKIFEIAKKHNLIVIEDCCQAHGAEYNGKKTPIGEIGCFSFYPSKNLGADGDAGMIVTDNEAVAEKLKLIRNYGQEKIYSSVIQGYNSRLDEIQAGILRVKLKHLDEWNEKRRNLAGLYSSLLKDNKNIILPAENPGNKHVYHLHVIRAEKRDKLMEFLKQKNIICKIHYPIPIHLQKGFENLGKKGDFPNSEKFSGEILSLPIFPELAEEEVKEVCRAIDEFYSAQAVSFN